MMLKYQDKKKLKENKKTIRKIIVLVLFFLLTSFGLWGILRGPVNFVSRPILMAGEWVSQSFYNASYHIKTKQSLYIKNNLLSEENSLLKTRILNYEIMENENLDLKTTLNRIPKPKNFVLANILTKSNRSVYDTVILDEGEEEGIKIGDMVYAYGEIPVGKIAESYSNSSLLLLFSSPNQKTEGFINGLNASVELVGRGGGNFETIIPMELNLENGTKIYLPGLSSQVIAIVIDVISGPSDPFKKVILNSPVNIGSLKSVQVKKD